MKVLFNRTVNDATCKGRAFFAGKVYELDKARVAMIEKKLDGAITILDEPKKKATKKAKKAKKEEPVTEAILESEPESEV